MFKFSSNNNSRDGRNNNSHSDKDCRRRNSPTDGAVKCPYCGSDSWFIYSVYFKCFLCSRIFGGKRLLMPCLLYTSPSPRDRQRSRMPSSA